MKNRVHLLAAVLLALLTASCNRNSIYSGFEKMENGAYMKFYERHDDNAQPRINDRVTFEMWQYLDDSLLFAAYGDDAMDIKLLKADFVGDVSDGLLMMHVGDSARLVILSDSVFIKMLDTDVPEEFAGKPIYYNLKLLSIKPFEEIEAEEKAILDSLRNAEQGFLVLLKSDSKNRVTEKGLIILEQKGQGKTAQMGDYVDFDFLLTSRDGDTLMNSFGVESVVMQYGEEFISEGFNEALGLVARGGTLHCIIPSELGFGEEGYHDFILPYEALDVRIRMNDIMDRAAYEKKMADREAVKEAERQNRLAKEEALIMKYLKDNGIDQSPTESGIYIIRKEEGTGELAQWGDYVSVHYTLNNLNGDQVESSYAYGEPMSFTIGQGEMIPCIEEAVMTMAPGAKVTVVAPSEQGFGEFTIHETLLPAYSPLLIELELVAIE